MGFTVHHVTSTKGLVEDWIGAICMIAEDSHSYYFALYILEEGNLQIS